MAKERTGVRVVSGTIGDAIDAYEAKQKARLARGEIRNVKKQTQNVADLRSNCSAVWGLNTPLSEMTQRRWEEYIGSRSDIKLSTLKNHLMAFRGLVRNHGLALGAPVIPDFDHLQVPKEQRSKRFEIITEAQWDELAAKLFEFLVPQDEKLGYQRSFSLNSKKTKGTGNRAGRIDQELEKHRRMQLYHFVMVLAASGLRPHEAAGYAEKSLRFRDVQEAGFEVETKQISSQKRPVVLLHVRQDTKTGQRIVPAACGRHIDQLRGEVPDPSPDAPLFQALNGKPMQLRILCLYWNEVVRRCKSIDRDVDIYEIRHLWATRRLKEGVAVEKVAKTMGNSVAVVTSTYSHILMSEEAMVRSLYENQLGRNG